MKDVLNLEKMAEEIEQLYNELRNIEEKYAPCCPPYLNMIQIIEDEYAMRIVTDRYFEKEAVQRETYEVFKKKLLQYVDGKLAEGTIMAWLDIVKCYNAFCVQPINLSHTDNEINILSTMLECMKEEAEAYREKGVSISVLQFESMDEIIEVYYRTIFLLRRIVYRMQEQEALDAFMQENALSVIFIRHVLEKAQIYAEDKEMLLGRIRMLEMEK